MTADCLPLLIASRDGRYVCSVHAGWQGLVSGIVDNSLACFRQQGWHWPIWSSPWGRIFTPAVTKSPPDSISNCWTSPAVTGWPAIASGCSTRSGPVSDPLKAAARGSDNLWFDLRAFAEAIFAEAGVAPASVEWLGSCTYCTRSRWAPTGAGPIFRRRRAFSIRGSCAKPEAGSR